MTSQSLSVHCVSQLWTISFLNIAEYLHCIWVLREILGMIIYSTILSENHKEFWV